MMRPIEMQMLLPRSESVGNMQQNEIQHAANVNSNAANEVVKNEQKLSEAVVEKEEKQFDTYQYDAKEEGNGKYRGSKGKQKRKSMFSGETASNPSSDTEEIDKTEVQPRINIQI